MTDSTDGLTAAYEAAADAVAEGMWIAYDRRDHLMAAMRVAVDAALPHLLARSSDGLREQIRDTLAGHYRLIRGANIARQECICGEWSITNRSVILAEERHRAHVADAVLAAIEEGNR